MKHNCYCTKKHKDSTFFDTCNEILPKEKKYCDTCLKEHMEVNYANS